MKTKIVHPTELSQTEIDQMFHLMVRHYDQMERSIFLKDLADKTWVIVLSTDEVVGFSTQKLIEFQGVKAVFSGDTIIAKEHWGSQHLSQAFARHFFDYEEDLYWFLISKGYKTYKYLPTFFDKFYPRYDEVTPEPMKALLDGYGRLLYPEEYNPDTGVISYHSDKDRLKEELLDLSAKKHDPHYDFFIQANPGYRKGDDLACLTLLRRDNLKPGRARLLFGE